MGHPCRTSYDLLTSLQQEILKKRVELGPYTFQKCPLVQFEGVPQNSSAGNIVPRATTLIAEGIWLAGSPGSAFRNKWLTSYQESRLVIKQDLPFLVTHGLPSAVL